MSDESRDETGPIAEVPADKKSPLLGKYAKVWQWCLWKQRQLNAAGRPPFDLESPDDGG